MVLNQVYVMDGERSLESMTTRKTVRIWGTRNKWSLAPHEDDPSAPSQERVVVLEIQGTPKHGYHLVMTPEGFFAADHHYASKEEALADAQELFGASVDDWNI